jgi:hypothetical protein
MQMTPIYGDFMRLAFRECDVVPHDAGSGRSGSRGSETARIRQRFVV